MIAIFCFPFDMKWKLVDDTPDNRKIIEEADKEIKSAKGLGVRSYGVGYDPDFPACEKLDALLEDAKEGIGLVACVSAYFYQQEF